MHPNDSPLPEALQERVLERLGLAERPSVDLDGLAALYAAWCDAVPFDNLRKLVHLHEGAEGPLAGDRVVDFFEAWLAWGSGGTCWAGNGALCCLLQALGFRASRGVATMLVAPDIPPNHGTVVVDLGRRPWLVDASILHGEPLLLDTAAGTAVEHPAWGVRCTPREGRWHIRWKALHMADGLDCRVEALSATTAEFSERHEQTRAWSPFNYEVSARRNRGGGVVGLAFGRRVEIDASGAVRSTPVDTAGRRRVLVEEIGIAPELADRVPDDRPTPPPPGTRAAAEGRKP